MVWPSQSTVSADPGSEERPSEKREHAPSDSCQCQSPQPFPTALFNCSCIWTAALCPQGKPIVQMGILGLSEGWGLGDDRVLFLSSKAGAGYPGFSLRALLLYRNHFLWWRSSCLSRTARLKPFSRRKVPGPHGFWSRPDRLHS